MKFDWHGGEITRTTELDMHYRNTQNVRRFLAKECGPDFKFSREFMVWIRNGNARNMGEVADEWMRRHSAGGRFRKKAAGIVHC